MYRILDQVANSFGGATRSIGFVGWGEGCRMPARRRRYRVWGGLVGLFVFDEAEEGGAVGLPELLRGEVVVGTGLFESYDGDAERISGVGAE